MCTGALFLVTSPFQAVAYSVICILAAVGLTITPAATLTAVGPVAIFFVTLSLILLVCVVSVFIIEKIKLASENLVLKQLKVSLEFHRTIIAVIPLENSFSCDEESKNLVSKGKILSNNTNTFFNKKLFHRQAPFNSGSYEISSKNPLAASLK